MGRRKKNENTETSKELAVIEKEISVTQEEVGEKLATEAEFADAEFTVKQEKEQREPEALELTIEADLFSGLRDAFNSTLQALLEKVTSREVDEGEVNLKLTISLENQNVLGHNVVIPSFKHVVTGNYKEKIENKGAFGIPQTYLFKNSHGEYELRALEDNLFSNEPVDAEAKEAGA